MSLTQGSNEKEDLYGKSAKKGEEKSDGLLTKVLHGLGEQSLKSVQTVALRIHPLKKKQFRVNIVNNAMFYRSKGGKTRRYSCHATVYIHLT